jgi:hypothetical protein
VVGDQRAIQGCANLPDAASSAIGNMKRTRPRREELEMTDADDGPATLTDDEIETHRVGGTIAAHADDTGDAGDTADTGDDAGDTADTGDDATDEADAGDDSGDDS